MPRLCNRGAPRARTRAARSASYPAWGAQGTAAYQLIGSVAEAKTAICQTTGRIAEAKLPFPKPSDTKIVTCRATARVAGAEIDKLEGVDTSGRGHKKDVAPKKTHFCYRKYVKDVKHRC